MFLVLIQLFENYYVFPQLETFPARAPLDGAEPALCVPRLRSHGAATSPSLPFPSAFFPRPIGCWVRSSPPVRCAPAAVLRTPRRGHRLPPPGWPGPSPLPPECATDPSEPLSRVPFQPAKSSRVTPENLSKSNLKFLEALASHV